MKKVSSIIGLIFIGFTINSYSSSSLFKPSKVDIKKSLYQAIQKKDFSKIVNNVILLELYNIKKIRKIKITKGEFEKTKDFNTRIQRETRKYKNNIQKYKNNIAKTKIRAKQKGIKVALQAIWGKPIIKNLKYDANNEYFIADVSFSRNLKFKKKIAIKVNIKYAKDLKANAKNLKPQAVFDYENNTIKLKSIRVPYKRKLYSAGFTDMKIDENVIAVAIGDNKNLISTSDISIDIDTNTNNLVEFDKSKLTDFNELEKLLRKANQSKIDNKKWLFVIGIEKYDSIDNIKYSRRSAIMFAKIMQKKLGVNKRNTFMMIDEKATTGRIKTNIKKMLRKVKKGDSIYFYYNGHGIPVPRENNTPYILASDMDPNFIADDKFFSLENIYSKLSKSKAKKIVAFVDSCFSGGVDGKGILRGVAATTMRAKKVNFNKRKMVVLSAGGNKEYSNGYDQKAYRMFSYFAMKNILNGKKDIKSIYQNTKKQTYNTSLSQYGDLRAQSPTINGNFRLKL